MYKAIALFTDLQDNGFRYEVGDEYPRLGLKPSLVRIAELSGPNNKRGIPLIEECEDMEALEIASEDVKEEVPKKKPGRKPKAKVEKED